MGERNGPQLGWRVQSDRAVRLMELLGLSEDELCRTLEVDPLAPALRPAPTRTTILRKESVTSLDPDRS
jgi:hypothetical protein